MADLAKGQEIFVNGKWWFDVTSVTDSIVTCNVEYKEGTNIKQTQYKKLKIDKTKMAFNQKNEWTVDERWLKKEYGSLVDRLVKSKNVYNLFEDAGANAGNTGGMGSVSMAGLSGSPGVPGSAGSGDVSGLIGSGSKSLFPKGTYGVEDLSKNLKTLKRLAKKGKNNKMGIKTPLLNVLKEAFDEGQEESENDFKRKLLDFLDFPWENDFDCSMVMTINEIRSDLMAVSSERAIQYLNDLWKTNMSYIKNNCSDDFINQIMVLGNIEA